MRLTEAVTGQVLRVVRVGGVREIKRRLMEMGVVKGTEIMIERYAPLMDPIQIRVKGYALAIRVAEGDAIEVTPLMGNL